MLRAVCLVAAVTGALAAPSTSRKEERQLPPLLNLPGGQSYDYIVVGAGTSGSALAARIAEDPSVTVAVLEAGTDLVDQDLRAYIPGADVLGCGASPLDTWPDIDWNYVTQPQAGAANRRIHYARGKGVGGSSQRNFMIYQRPTVGSFDYWQDAVRGLRSPGWSWRDVYPYYTKSVVLTPPDNAIRGAQYTPSYNPEAYPETDPTKAPLSLTYANFAFEYSASLRSAFNELGYPNATDFNSGTLNGVQYDTSTIRHTDGHRASGQEFIRNAQRLGRNNLVVLTNSLAKKVNFDSNKRAVSVTYTRGAGLVQQTVYAKREIIVSAGAFGSPQLLMASGVGPRDQLQQFGIPIVSELPGVGQGMQDHIFFSPGYSIRPDIYNFGKESEALNIILQSGAFLFTNTGSLTNPVADYLGWQRLNQTFFDAHPEAAKLASYPADWPHIEYISAAGLTKEFQNLLIENAVPAALGQYYYSLLGTIVAPLSRGTVRLASADTAQLPLIDPGWLTDKGDQAVAIEIYRKVRRLFNTQAFKAARRDDQEFYPGYEVESDADILATIQKSLLTVWHAACTCAMGRREDNAVVDPYFRVYGVQGLRVVDASSFPSLPPGHPQSTCYMIAERAADFLRADRGAPITTTPRSPPRGDAGPLYSGPN